MWDWYLSALQGSLGRSRCSTAHRTDSWTATAFTACCARRAQAVSMVFCSCCARSLASARRRLPRSASASKRDWASASPSPALRFVRRRALRLRSASSFLSRGCHGGNRTVVHGVKFRGLRATEPFRRRRRSMLVRLSLGRSSLIAWAAQSVGTCDLVPKKRVVSLQTGCCSSPKSSSGFRGRRMRSGARAASRRAKVSRHHWRVRMLTAPGI